MELEPWMAELKTKIAKDEGRRDQIAKKLDLEKFRQQHNHGEAVKARAAVEVVNAATELRRQELRDRVEELVTKGLRAVFERTDLRFSFKLSTRSDRFGVEPVLISGFGDEELEVEIADGHGGGVADIVAFLLRVVVLCLARPKLSRVMILDETFKHVSPEYLRGVAVLLKELSESAGMQFVLVTHKPELLDAADVIYRASLDPKGQTKFELEHDLKDEVYHKAPKRGQSFDGDDTVFDHEDLGRKEHGKKTISKTADSLAKRQRRYRKKRPKTP